MGAVKKIDSKGRLTLGEAFSNRTVIVEEKTNGELLIKPALTIPASEKWLFENPEALKLVMQGIKGAQAKKFVKSPIRKEDKDWIDELEDN